VAPFKREIKPVESAGKTRFKVAGDPSQRAFNTREDAELQRTYLEVADDINGIRRS
jgi:hypothetical protein